MADTKPAIDLETCAREPIHILGLTQAHGFLIAVSEPDFIVRHISANVPLIVAREPAEILGGPLESLVGREQCEKLRAGLAAGDFLAYNPLRMNFGRRAQLMECVAHRHGGMLVIELQPQAGTYSLEPLNLAVHLQGPAARMERQDDLRRLAVCAADEFARASGYDRVMIYQFDADWHGTVIAEAGGKSPSFLGLHFPASDIPAQARRLYLINTLRTIVDVDAEPVPLIPALDPSTRRPMDLSRSTLRSASPIHLQYLRNMGVRATLTVSIIVRGELWGLVAAHHYSPHRLDFTARAVCDLLGQILSAQIHARINVEALQERIRSRDRIEAYMTSIERSELPPPGDALHMVRLLSLFNADALVTRIHGSVFSCGTTLDEAELGVAIAALREGSHRGIASSDQLGALDPVAGAFAPEASGALYLGFSQTSDDYIVLLRREVVQTIDWAGDPQKATTPDPATGVLNPRASFDAWRDVKRGRSLPWTELEIENARLLREQFMQLREAQQRARAEDLIRHLANHDVLTGLPNRGFIAQRLDASIASAARDGGGLALLFIDLDHFKAANDRHGHAAGDRILQMAASRMQLAVRADDIVGRLAGDEFIVIAPGIATEAQASDTAARIVREIEAPFDIGEGVNVRITASVGVSRYPVDGETGEALLKRSDMAMYRVKRSGGNAFDVSPG